MKKQIKKNIAKRVKKILDVVLCVEANSTSCMFIYQPKVPKMLEKFREK